LFGGGGGGRKGVAIEIFLGLKVGFLTEHTLGFQILETGAFLRARVLHHERVRRCAQARVYVCVGGGAGGDSHGCLIYLRDRAWLTNEFV
jgi:hypothetical protein